MIYKIIEKFFRGDHKMRLNIFLFLVIKYLQTPDIMLWKANICNYFHAIMTSNKMRIKEVLMGDRGVVDF